MVSAASTRWSLIWATGNPCLTSWPSAVHPGPHLTRGRRLLADRVCGDGMRVAAVEGSLPRLPGPELTAERSGGRARLRCLHGIPPVRRHTGPRIPPFPPSGVIACRRGGRYMNVKLYSVPFETFSPASGTMCSPHVTSRGAWRTGEVPGARTASCAAGFGGGALRTHDRHRPITFPMASSTRYSATPCPVSAPSSGCAASPRAQGLHRGRPGPVAGPGSPSRSGPKAASGPWTSSRCSASPSPVSRSCTTSPSRSFRC